MHLSAQDNVVVLTRHVEIGDVLSGLDGAPWTITAHLEPGNKLASRPIAAGESVVKYGFPIGTATRAIAPGAHVHTHNLQSDYIPIESEESAHAD
jgi:hypothetical protein